MKADPTGSLEYFNAQEDVAHVNGKANGVNGANGANKRARVD